MSLKAGDPAPEVDWTKLVRSPESSKDTPSLAGQFTLLQFLPLTPNRKAVARWNDLIAQFEGKPVQFVWVVSESSSAIEPFLREHPLNGWLLPDELRETASAWGCDEGTVLAIVGPSGTLLGFTSFIQPEQLSAILEGNAAGWLESEPRRFEPPVPPLQPDFPPSYEVHISPTKTDGTNSYSSDTIWMRLGFDLKAMIAMVWEKDPSRVNVPAALDNGDRFDFVMLLPRAEDEAAIHRLVRDAIEKQFNVSVVAESRPADVYVMTAIPGKTPPSAETFGDGFSSFRTFGFNPPPGTPNTPEAMKQVVEEMMKHPHDIGIASISADGVTMDDFRRLLEHGLGRPVLDETGLTGVYEIEVQSDAANTEAFIRNLSRETGLTLTLATREIEFLNVRLLN